MVTVEGVAEALENDPSLSHVGVDRSSMLKVVLDPGSGGLSQANYLQYGCRGHVEAAAIAGRPRPGQFVIDGPDAAVRRG